MTFNEAMALIRRDGVREVARAGAGFGIGWRFGRPVMLGEGESFIDYTPTREDMTATDWLLVGDPDPRKATGT